MAEIITTGGGEEEERGGGRGRVVGDDMRVVTIESALTAPGDLRERALTTVMTDQGEIILEIETKRGTKMATRMGRLVMPMTIPAAATGKEARRKDGSTPLQ